jgi:glycerol-3-phosphate dehydrogenase
MNTNKVYDLLIIGGGINGVGIAADAAGRGLSVYLCEQDDLASHTSSASSKMIHGGLRYLEYYEFRLVREALAERDVLLSIAPHIVQPLHLVIPHNDLQRPAWLIRLGLFLYDTLGLRWGRKSFLDKSHGVALTPNNEFGKPLKADLKRGFIYSDCKVDDARLVVLNAMSAARAGASINTHTQLLQAERHDGLWKATLKNKQTGETFSIASKTLINAAGPWVDTILRERLGIESKHHIELIKGSHIVVPRLYGGSHAYLLQNTDKRVVFVIPYHDQFTMIGTTDLAYHGDPAVVKIDEAEVKYLLSIVNRYFNKSIQAIDIVNNWSGVRPLQAEDKKNPSAVTRDYTVEVDAHDGAPLLSIFGGKITTYRKLAEHALEKLTPYFSHLSPAWTGTKPLPGGELPKGDLKQFMDALQQKHSWLPPSLVTRYSYSYGTLCEQFLSNKTQLSDLGEKFGADLYEAEVRYLREQEWARTAEDILWRRTKLGLLLTPTEVKKLEAFCEP